jgi:hypothetical protein
MWRAGLKCATDHISLNTHDKCHAIAAAVPGYTRKKFPLPFDRELGPHRDRSVDSNADPGRRGVLDLGRSQVRGSGLVFPANLGHGHHGRSRFCDMDGLVHDFFYIDTKEQDLSTVGASTCDWPAFG